MSYTNTILDHVEWAIQKAKRINEENGVKNYDRNDPHRMWLFNLARVTLGDEKMFPLLEKCWKLKEWPIEGGCDLISYTIRRWVEYHEDVDGMDASDIDPKELFGEFVSCVWRIRVPSQGPGKGHAMDGAVQRGIESFKGNDPDPRAVALIRREDFKQPHLKLLVHILYQCRDAYNGNEFPIAQDRMADEMNKFVPGCSRVNVGRFLALLKRRGYLKVAEKAIAHRRAALYRLSAIGENGGVSNE